jgi:hypothetical protein
MRERIGRRVLQIFEAPALLREWPQLAPAKMHGEAALRAAAASEKLFGKAARNCLLRASLRPGVGLDGQSQRSRTAVKVRFVR